MEGGGLWPPPFCYDTHMFRTRDFVLLFTAIAFLVGAIGVTTISKLLFPTQFSPSLTPTESTDTIYSAEIIEDTKLSKEERLRTLREKISARPPTVVSKPPEEANVPEPNRPLASGVQNCSWYAPSERVWSSTGITFALAEGNRLVYREFKSETSATNTASREVLLQLPLPVGPLDASTCVATDVVGIALDGSLIRNNEATLYRVFANDVHIGYALDGFPLYGIGAEPTDTCGGRLAGGQYRYELSNNRETVLNCFSSPPVTF